MSKSAFALKSRRMNWLSTFAILFALGTCALELASGEYVRAFVDAVFAFVFAALHFKRNDLMMESARSLRATDSRHLAMLKALPEGLLRVRRDGTILDCHRPEATPIGAGAILGKNIVEVAPEAFLLEGFARMLSTIERDVHQEFEVVLPSPDGFVRIFEIRCVKSGDDEAFVIARDVTAQREAQTTIEQQRAMMVNSAKMSALGEMTGTIGHEINNPLMVIRGYADEIRRQGETLDAKTSKQIVDGAQKIAQMTARIARIVKSIRTMSRNGDQDPFFPAQVSKVVGDAVEMCRDRMKTAGIDFFAEDVPDDLFIECRHVQIIQVLVNLLNNAHDAIEKNKEKWITVSAMDRGDCVEISVIDSGRGIGGDLQAKVFQPFFTTKEIGKGSGLGLSVSKGIVEAHGGSLKLDGKRANTAFVLTLPKQAANSESGDIAA